MFNATEARKLADKYHASKAALSVLLNKCSGKVYDEAKKGNYAAVIDVKLYDEDLLKVVMDKLSNEYGYDVFLDEGEQGDYVELHISWSATK